MVLNLSFVNILSLLSILVFSMACKQKANTKIDAVQHEVILESEKENESTNEYKESKISSSANKKKYTPEGNKVLIDSAVIYASFEPDFGTKLVDSIFIYFKNKTRQNIYKKQNTNIGLLQFNKISYCFEHFNDDEHLDLFFPTIGGGSGGQIDVIFLYNSKKQRFEYQKLLSGWTQLSYNKIKRHYISQSRSGINRYTTWFVLNKNRVKVLGHFDTDYLQSVNDSITIRFTYKNQNGNETFVVCKYHSSDDNLIPCNKNMEQIEQQIW